MKWEIILDVFFIAITMILLFVFGEMIIYKLTTFVLDVLSKLVFMLEQQEGRW